MIAARTGPVPFVPDIGQCITFLVTIRANAAMIAVGVHIPVDLRLMLARERQGNISRRHKPGLTLLKFRCRADCHPTSEDVQLAMAFSMARSRAGM
ncbi:hypothetical protein ACEUZ9_000930 [Paracoccus litorisediminis]|uniref:hypothetical protein n=1 Tax=Paracoccus litorisediminis TaxID=2006130 RepID=UPI00373184B0